MGLGAFLAMRNDSYRKSFLSGVMKCSGINDGCTCLLPVVKNTSASAKGLRDPGSIPGLGRFPGRGHGTPLQCSYLENPHGQRSLVGYTPGGCKELDITVCLSTRLLIPNF